MNKKILSALKISFFLSIGIFFIWIFLRQLTPAQKLEIWESFIHANFAWLGVALAIGFFSHLVRAMRWRMLLEPIGYRPGLVNTFLAVMIGYFANMALPRLGEVTRCGVLHRYEKIPMNKSIGTVIVERSIDMVVFVTLFFINFVIFFDKLESYVDDKVFTPLSQKFRYLEDSSFYLTVLISVFALMTILFFLFRNKFKGNSFYIKVRELLLGFWHGLRSVTRIKNPLAFIFQSILIWILYFLMIYVCIFTLTETSHLGIGAGLSMLIFGSIGIMIVQGGIGIYPVIIAETLAIYGIQNTTGYALGWLTWTAQTILIVFVGIISLIVLPIINRKVING
ncbi:MAG: flippase-like domain-containing protein [Bacteroidales bacterium]|nr:flippase-like domain-containing protein [Bacteroidales bacterium]